MSDARTTEASGLRSGAEALAALGDIPGGRELVAVAGRRADVALVGGAVRDLLLRRSPRELDVTVAQGSQELAAELVRVLPEAHEEREDRAQSIVYERFGTASIEWAAGRIDIAELRAESYPSPGALPEVRPGSIEEDLARRDFTVNAISLTLGGDGAGAIRAAPDALEDLAAGRMRILHERSFIDDPTRLLRLARYAARLRFATEGRTAALAREAVQAGALDTVSRARIGAELMLALDEEEPLRSLEALEQLGVLAAIGLAEPFDVALASEALGILPPDGDRALVLAAVLFAPGGDTAGIASQRAAAEQLDGFLLQAAARERVLAGAFDAPALAARLGTASRPSQLRALLEHVPVEAIAIAAVLAGRGSREAREHGERWLAELRHVRLQISGDDLIAAGIEQGPDIGARLAHTLDLKLDGRLHGGRERELQAAVEGRP